MTKNYKEYQKKSIGGSDIATLIIASPGISDGSGKGGDTGMLKELWFGSDGSYSAYVVDENCIIPDYYKLFSRSKSWIKIYDDAGLKFNEYAKEINIYRAGDYGVIIQLLGQRE